MAYCEASRQGILIIDKPRGFTSFDAVAKLRGMTRVKKLGHAGTLDPMATGVLPVFFGRAAKAIDLLPNHDKTYEAELRLGITTATYDVTGEIIKTGEFKHICAADVENALAKFHGEQEQTPPMYSAVRVDGKRLYDLARKGREVPRPARRITVREISLTSADEARGVYGFRVSCSRGTYIRTICHDLGQTLGCGAAMSALRRTFACGYGLDDCVTLEQAQQLVDSGALFERLLPVESAFAALPRFTLDESRAARFVNGLALALGQFGKEPPPEVRLAVYGPKERFLGLAEVDGATGTLKIVKLFALEETH